MGAGTRRHVRSAAAAMPGSMPVTCGNIPQQRLCRLVRSVRIEGAELQSRIGRHEHAREYGAPDHLLGLAGKPVAVPYYYAFVRYARVTALPASTGCWHTSVRWAVPSRPWSRWCRDAHPGGSTRLLGAWLPRPASQMVAAGMGPQSRGVPRVAERRSDAGRLARRAGGRGRARVGGGWRTAGTLCTRASAANGRPGRTAALSSAPQQPLRTSRCPDTGTGARLAPTLAGPV